MPLLWFWETGSLLTFGLIVWAFKRSAELQEKAYDDPGNYSLAVAAASLLWPAFWALVWATHKRG